MWEAPSYATNRGRRCTEITMDSREVNEIVVKLLSAADKIDGRARERERERERLSERETVRERETV